LPYPFNAFAQRRPDIGIDQKRLAPIRIYREEIGGSADRRTPVVGHDGSSRQSKVENPMSVIFLALLWRV
jgi:hypothetical protein